MAATDILDRALALMRNEMEHSEDSLSLAMYEYSGTCLNDRMNYFNRIGEKNGLVSMTPEVYDSITNHIRKQLIKEQ